MATVPIGDPFTVSDHTRRQRIALSAKPKQVVQVHALSASTSVHPGVIMISFGAAAWFVFISWVIFAADRESTLAVAFVTVIFVMYTGCLTYCAMMTPNVTPDQAPARSFTDFLDGDVDIATGLITGREALIQIATLPLTLAIGGTIIALCWVFIR